MGIKYFIDRSWIFFNGQFKSLKGFRIKQNQQNDPDKQKTLNVCLVLLYG